MSQSTSPARNQRKDAIHRRALRAAAAATLTIAPGCGGAQQRAKTQAQPKDDTPKATAPVASTASQSDAPKTAAPPSAKTAAGTPPAAAQPPDCSSSRGLGSACCEKARKWCQGKYPGTDNKARMEQDRCFFSVPGCMPWGPPAPPRYEANLSPRLNFSLHVAA